MLCRCGQVCSRCWTCLTSSTGSSSSSKAASRQDLCPSRLIYPSAFSSFLLFPAYATCVLIIAALLLRPSPSAATTSDNVHSRTFRRTGCHGWVLRQWPLVRGLVKRAASGRRSRRRPVNSCLASPSARCSHGVVHHVVSSSYEMSVVVYHVVARVEFVCRLWNLWFPIDGNRSCSRRAVGARIQGRKGAVVLRVTKLRSASDMARARPCLSL
jgi:hypothetical protein